MTLVFAGSGLPDDKELLRRLSSVMPGSLTDVCKRTAVTIQGRGYATEIVEIWDGDGVLQRIFAKHGVMVDETDSYRGGHIGGLAYEHRWPCI